jgi:membrane peptidoglycan carboxypeptidase
MIVLGIALVFALGTAGPLSATVYGDLTTDLPGAESIEQAFLPDGLFQPVKIYDRSGSHVLYEAIHPSAADRRWYPVDRLPSGVGSGYAEAATIAAESLPLGPGGGDDSQGLAASVAVRPEAAIDSAMESITRRLAVDLLQPLEDSQRPALVRSTRTGLLMGELVQRYPPARLLAWYMNSTPYGHLTFGLDAAGLVYFGKHASELSLAETAALAAAALDPALNPLDAPGPALARRNDVIRRMQAMGFITAADASSAVAAPASPIAENAGADYEAPAFVQVVWDSLSRLLGPGAQSHGGLKVITTIDYDLQMQAECTSATHLARMGGGDAAALEPTADGSTCVAAGLLPPLRPSDTGIDHGIDQSAIVVLDPTRGQILSMVGPAASLHLTGDAFSPLIYLTAFARGYAPATMVVDVPVQSAAEDSPQLAPEEFRARYHGPVRMRTALANSYAAATTETARLAGVDNVLRTAHQMGLQAFADSSSSPTPEGMLESAQSSLLDLTYAYGIWAVQGQMVGVPVPADLLQSGYRSLDPVIVVRVEDPSGEVVYGLHLSERSVVSPQLAYLMANVLSDEAARWPTLGQPNPLEIGRPAAAKTGMSPDGRGAWTVGFTPRLAVGVWVGSEGSGTLTGVEPRNGAAPIWHALTRYASRDVGAEAWAVPPGVSEIDVCDPSGLLPTAYCPQVVREVFPQGTEPTHYDNLYQPYRINRETGKLATLFTPIDQVEERVYLIPPPEAMDWAKEVGLPQPPEEYDPLVALPATSPVVQITTPGNFDYVHGRQTVVGVADPDDFEYYRLQYGAGLNPTRWFQIGSDVTQPVQKGELGVWDTSGLSGLYTLQLVVVRQEGQVSTAAALVTIDNHPPDVQIVQPYQGQTFSLASSGEVSFQVDASDDLSLGRLNLYIDGRIQETLEAPPYSIRWKPTTIGEHVFFVRAYDAAGNLSESQQVMIEVTR